MTPRAALLALVAALVVLSFASAMPTDTDQVDVSPELQRLLAEDKAFIDGERRALEGKHGQLESIKQNQAYSYAVATKLFWHSVSAYCPNTGNNLQSWSCSSCKQFGQFQTTAVSDTGFNQAYVGFFTQGLPASPIPGTSVKASDPFVLLSFRGTVPTKISNWIEDLSFSKFSAFSASYPAASVHSGFWAAYQGVKPGLMAGLRTALSKSGAKTIIVTGHSLGGAMAELAAIDLKLNEFPSLTYASYTQGTPRVGNAAFSALFADKLDASFREIHQADVVAHLPPKLLNFQHGPMEIWFDAPFATYRVCNASLNGEDPRCSNSLALPISVTDHINYRGISMGSYCGATKLNLGAEAGVVEEHLTAEEMERLAESIPAAEELPVEEVDYSVPVGDDEATATTAAAANEMVRRPRIILTEI